MKIFYDKFLLALAVLALLGGAAFYYMQSAEAANTDSTRAYQAADNPYEVIPISDPVATLAKWPEPGPQSSGPDWLYDVFTPPKIYIDAEGNFTAKPPKLKDKEEPFGIYLADISRELYRFQIEGFSGDRAEPDECVVFIYDEERELKLFIKPGQSNDESEIEVLNFTIDREIDADNNVNVTAVATILDKRTGESVRLVDGERLYESGVTVTLRSEQDPGVMIELEEEGATFETPSGQYILKEINLENRTVTVEKEATEESDAKTLTLSPKIQEQPETTLTNEEPTDSSTNEGDFDSFFR